MRFNVLGIIMAVAIAIGISPESQAIIDNWQGAYARLGRELDGAITQILNEADAFWASSSKYWTGGAGPGGGSVPVGMRSGGATLRNQIAHEKTAPLSGYVGIREGTASAYARVILGPDDTTIRPRNAKHLWIPIADNLNPSGGARWTPRMALERGARIFTSKAGNKLVFEPDEKGGKYKSGKKKGLRRGKLLFVLKDQVTIRGTDALAQAMQEFMPRASVILDSAIKRSVG